MPDGLVTLTMSPEDAQIILDSLGLWVRARGLTQHPIHKVIRRIKDQLEETEPEGVAEGDVSVSKVLLDAAVANEEKHRADSLPKRSAGNFNRGDNHNG